MYVQRKGLAGTRLKYSMKARTRCCRSSSETKLPRLRSRQVRMLNQISTWLSHEQCHQEGRRDDGAPELEVEFDGGMIPVATLEPIESDDGEGEPELTPVRKLPGRRTSCRWEEVKAGLAQELSGRPAATTR